MAKAKQYVAGVEGSELYVHNSKADMESYILEMIEEGYEPEDLTIFELGMQLRPEVKTTVTYKEV